MRKAPLRTLLWREKRVAFVFLATLLASWTPKLMLEVSWALVDVHVGHTSTHFDSRQGYYQAAPFLSQQCICEYAALFTTDKPHAHNGEPR